VTLIGELALWVALLLSGWSTAVSYTGGALRSGGDSLTESGVRGLYATFVMVAVAAAGLWAALLSRDFSLEYVAGHISQNTPGIFAFAAFWSGQAGAVLLWALVLSMCGAIAVALMRRRDRSLVPWTTGTLSAVLLFLVATACFDANPFARLDVTPLNGQGMEPRLQNLATALHQPTLLIGYATTTVPFALTIGALCTRRLSPEWFGAARRWTLFSWLFLTIGILFGMRSSYLEPERVNAWSWYAVETSSILPWLTSSASLHSMVAQATRTSLRKWTVVLLQATFLLSIFAASMTRSGAVDIGLSPVRSPWFSAFFFMATGITVYLVGTRLREAEPGSDLEAAVRDRRRFGGYVVYAGVVLLLAGLSGLLFRRASGTQLKTGESYQATDPFGHVWRFVSQGVSQFDRADYIVAILALDTYRDGKRVGLITSERRTYRDSDGNQVFQPSVQVGLHSATLVDTYIVPTDLRREKGSDIADVNIEFNPLVTWIWAGGIVMVIGGLIVMWPRTKGKQSPLPHAAT
jgi:cytochrome c biogenesis factor